MTNDGDSGVAGASATSVNIDMPSMPNFDSDDGQSWGGEFEASEAEDAAAQAREAKMEATRARAEKLRREKEEAQRIEEELEQKRGRGYTDSLDVDLPPPEDLPRYLTPLGLSLDEQSPRAKISRASRKLLGRDFMNYLIQANRIDPAEYKSEARKCPSWTPAGLGAVATFADRARIKTAESKHRIKVAEVRSRKEQYLQHIRVKGPPQKVYAGLLKSALGNDANGGSPATNLRVVRNNGNVGQKTLTRSGASVASNAAAQAARQSRQQRQQRQQQRQQRQQQRQQQQRQQQQQRRKQRQPMGSGGSFDDDDLNSWGDRSYEVAEQVMAQSTTKWAQNVEKNTSLYPAAFIRPGPFIDGGGGSPGKEDGDVAGGRATSPTPSFAGAGSLAEVVFEGGDIYGQLESEARLFEFSGGHNMYASGRVSPLGDGPRPGTGGRLGGGHGPRAASPGSRPLTAPAPVAFGARGKKNGDAAGGGTRGRSGPSTPS